MKKVILSVAVMAFAVAVQAGDAKTCPMSGGDKPACCAKAKAEQTKACCPAAKAKASKLTVSKPLASPKAMTLAKS